MYGKSRRAQAFSVQDPSRRARLDRLPIIDIAPLYGADRGAWNDVARRIDQACREWGFFYIAG
ncbi:2-oxoglutarate and iron-dependent oxygenase domain-containing protein, partial [Salmonella sp. E393-2]|uniref:2-oxoglutarate and iron-dependent oxygenase domain-containing protein n=1 Tax=Salmonella sp. E393-2 TaxID=3240324 RepID=UPI00352B218B